VPAHNIELPPHMGCQFFVGRLKARFSGCLCFGLFFLIHKGKLRGGHDSHESHLLRYGWLWRP
jgi:hypothetical protein